MGLLFNLNKSWKFKSLERKSPQEQVVKPLTVDLPHTAVEVPFNYFDEATYQKKFIYSKHIAWSDQYLDKRVSLVFDGAMANAQVSVDGIHVASHPDGYTPFEVLLPKNFGENGASVDVEIDGAENPNIPPFGGRIDYLTYAGIYRDVWLKVEGDISIGKVKVETHDVLSARPSVVVKCSAMGSAEGDWLAEVVDSEGQTIAVASHVASGTEAEITLREIADVKLWSNKTPELYVLRLTLTCGDDTDVRETRFGFREANFTPKGFFLNGERLKLIGLNRHQSFPYTGYAQGRASQEKDAEILKYELGCNIVRTSHYPQSPWFLDHCDRIGLLVLEEIPGWQHLGGEAWKDEAVRNVERMIERDWNHPSIILWGVRINESPDDTGFYTRTNSLAHELDPTRQTGGIRNHTDSEFLEDVYTFNDFILGEPETSGANQPRTALRDQRDVTGLSTEVPYLVTEYNGHMYPTKVYDSEERQIEHVKRHLEVLNATFGDDSISGCIGWCMFDYNTHQDFGSGDRVCHHGVMTMFREPKFAAYAYSSQMDTDDKVVLQPVTYWARGERSIGGVFPLMVLTNCDRVLVRFRSGTEVTLKPDTENYPHLPHPPMVLDTEALPYSELGRWGHVWHDVDIIGYVSNREVARKTMLAGAVADHLEVAPDLDVIHADHGEVRVAVRALDQAGNILPYLNTFVDISITGQATLVGPNISELQGGATAFWMRPTGKTGEIQVTVKSPRFAEQSIKIFATLEEEEAFNSQLEETAGNTGA